MNRMKPQTITENLSLFQAHSQSQLKKIRREIRRLERRQWMDRAMRWLQELLS